jgi:thiol-disulfide isomerase/thioredoxin
MKNLIIALLVFVSLCSCAQNDFLFSGEIQNSPGEEVIVMSLYGDNVEILDTVATANGQFFYSPGPAVSHGVLRLDAGNRNYIDLIYDGNPVAFVVDYNDPLLRMEITESDENRLWYRYRQSRESFERRLAVLGNALSYYPDNDPFYATMQDEYLTILEDQEVFMDEMVAMNTKTMAGFLISCDIMPVIPQEFSPKDQLAWVKDHFYDNIDFSDGRILYSDILPKKIIEYLKLYANRNLSRDELEKEYMKSVDRIMSFVGGKNDEVEEMVINHMIKGFQQLEFQEVLTYIVNQYVLESSCVDEERKATLEQRIEGFDKMAIGQTIPEFSITTKSNEVITNATDTPYRLIMFWASWCPHCLEDMPAIISELNKVERSEIEVILVSVDEVKQEWEAAIEKHPGWWKESCDLKGWNGDMANDFYIYATPTILLLDQSGKILSKPVNSGQLKLALQQEGLLP